MKRIFTLLLWAAASAVLAGVCAWLISTQLVPRSFTSVFVPCLIGTVLATVLFVTFNVIEAAIQCAIYLVLAVFSIPIAAHFQAPAFPYVAAASFISGYAASRILRTSFFL